MIMTVNGEISKKDLGITSPHEHIFIDMKKCVTPPKNPPKLFYDKVRGENRAEVWQDPYAILDNALLDEKTKAIDEVKYFKKYGGQTIIDCTLDEIGRNPLLLKKISNQTGVNIIMGCGHYYHKAHPDYIKNTSVDNLAQEIINDITVGVGKTNIKAGIIGEIGTSAVITDDEKKVLRAAGIASAKTDKAIHVHTDLYTENGFKIIEILKAEGANEERICIDHVDVWIRPDYIKGLLDKGVYIEFDNFGKEFYLSKKLRFAYDLERIKILKELIDEGYKDKILISNDICLKTMWKNYGGLGYAHILKGVMSMAEENGIDKDTYLALLTNNVAEFVC